MARIIFLLDRAGIQHLEFSSTDGPGLDRTDHPEFVNMDLLWPGRCRPSWMGLRGRGGGGDVRRWHKEVTGGEVTQGKAGSAEESVFPVT